MDYFKILNLNREPFSNSPEPEFFYESSQHLGCLQKLEIAIRLHRGLNVVMGIVGTGKTTLCRELLIRFAKSEEDRHDVETHLLLDPSIGTPREFLATIATTFGISRGETAESEWQLKESIKHYLFKRGVDEKKTVVLIIDEGQKLPDFGVEILREFLNYETNEAKLLQIVIFAQDEFAELLRWLPNFADRINQIIALKPLNFRETRQMIAFRIARAGGDKPPRLFTWPGLWAVYRATGGYPRKIITLCHQSMLTLIIQNRKRASWSMVRSCAERLSTEGMTGRRRVVIAAASLALLLVVAAGIAAGILEWRFPGEKGPPLSGKAANAIVEKRPVPAAAVTVAPQPPASPPALPVLNTKKPDVLGRMIVNPGETVYGLLRRIYGAYDDAQLRAFVQANRRIKDINKIRSGDVVTLPAIPVPRNPLPPEYYWVAVMVEKSLGEAYESLLSYPSAEGGVRLFPYWNPQEGMLFAVLIRNGFPDEKAADAFIQRLPAEFSPGARVIAKWPEGTEFYAR